MIRKYFVFLFMTILAIPVSADDWTLPDTIKRLNISNNGSVRIELTKQNPACGSDSWEMPVTTDKYKMKASIALMAYKSGQQIRLYGGGCCSYYYGCFSKISFGEFNQ